MNVFTGISRLVSDAGWKLGFARDPEEQSEPRSAIQGSQRVGRGSRRGLASSISPRLPVRVGVELDESEPLGESSASEDSELASDANSAPRSRHEMLTELKKNYAEAVTLMRKVDGHLSRQEQRTLRLVEMAERLPEVIGGLDRIAGSQDAQQQALSTLHDAVERAGVASERAQGEQVAAIQRVETRLETVGRSEQRLAETLEEFRTIVGGMANSNDRIGQVLERLQQRDTLRDEHVRELTDRSRRSLHLVLGVSVLAALATAAAATGLVMLALKA